jgi:glycosyltransferase involved in cell wall biosynthesis
MTTRPHRHGIIPDDILALSHERDMLRRKGQYDRADYLKRQIEEAGYAIKDNPRGAHLVILPGVDVDGTEYRTTRHISSLLDEPDTCLFSVNILARNSLEQTQRCIESILRSPGADDKEIILVDNASDDGLSIWADALRCSERRLHVLRLTRLTGEAEARNIGLKQSRGRYILLIDTALELTGNIFAPLQKTLENSTVGVTGWRGLRTDDLRHFEESSTPEVDVIDARCMAFRRSLLKKVGLFDERFRFPTYMDVDFNFAVRDSGASVVITPNLPATYLPAVQDVRFSDAERTRLTKRNFYRFLEKWGDRDDLLMHD